MTVRELNQMEGLRTHNTPRRLLQGFQMMQLAEHGVYRDPIEGLPTLRVAEDEDSRPSEPFLPVHLAL